MAKHGSPGQLALFEATRTRRRHKRYVPTYDHYSREALGYVQGWKAAERSKVYGHEKAIGYLTKYLTGKHPPEFLQTISGPVLTVSRSLTRRTGVTMVALRKARPKAADPTDRGWSAGSVRRPRDANNLL
jgi:hypothetical protein